MTLNDLDWLFNVNLCVRVYIDYLSYEECFGDSDLRRSADVCNETFQTKTIKLHALTDDLEKRQQYCASVYNNIFSSLFTKVSNKNNSK